MPDDGISPCADDPLVGQLAGILCRMVKAGKLKHLDSCRPKLSVQVCGVSRDTVRVNTALLTDEGVVSTVFCGKCASTLGLEEQERHRRLEPGVSTRQSLVNRTGGDHGPVREINGKEPYRQHACHHGTATTQVRQSSVPAVTRARLRARRIRRHRRARCGSRNSTAPGMRTRRDEPIRERLAGRS